MTILAIIFLLFNMQVAGLGSLSDTDDLASTFAKVCFLMINVAV